MTKSKAAIPPASPRRFVDGISHPDLWLWDSWTHSEDGRHHLYCLALSRTDLDGNPILPPQRNDHFFHVRHFESEDDGTSWTDCGVVLKPAQMIDGSDSRNIWSGSVLPDRDGRFLFAWTGVGAAGEQRPFIQSICVAQGQSPHDCDQRRAVTLSSALRDYDDIRAHGYYLGPKDKIGSTEGEDGGPILAWRDPFLLRDKEGVLHAAWSAKVAPTVPAIALARLEEATDGSVRLGELLPPMTLPDADAFTQAEVPKILELPDGRGYLLLISACSRLFEGQPDSEVRQEQRLYKATSLAGPWRPYREAGSLLPGLGRIFGASVLDYQPDPERLRLFGPFTENAGPRLQLSFPKPFMIDLGGLSAPA